MYFTNGILKLFNTSRVLVFIYYNRTQDVVQLLFLQIPNYTKSTTAFTSFRTHWLPIKVVHSNSVHVLCYLLELNCGPGSSVGTATDYGLDGSG